MPRATLAISPRPELVRIARMMSVSMARRGGLPDPLLDEVRLAVGEAVSRAVLINAGRDGSVPVRLILLEDDRGYQVDVHDAGDPTTVPDMPLDLPDLSAEDALSNLPAGMDLALIAGMADHFEVRPDPVGGTIIRLRWMR